MPIRLPAHRLKELEARMLTDRQVRFEDYRPLTDNINVFNQWETLQRITETLKRSNAEWGYRKSNHSKKLLSVQVWRIMPNNLDGGYDREKQREYCRRKRVKILLDKKRAMM